MNRRALLLGSAALGLLISARARTQQAVRVRRIGYLSSASAGRDARYLAVFNARLRELGYSIGKDVIIDERYADGRFENLAGLAAELIARKPDLLLVVGAPAAHAAAKATRVIPIVMAYAADPVGTGLVASLARPGANLTGVSAFNEGVVAKLFELAKEMVPRAGRIGVLSNPSNPANPAEVDQLRDVAAKAGVKLISYEARTDADVDRALAAMGKDRPNALIVVGDPLLGVHSRKIVAVAGKTRVPAIFSSSQGAEAGGLMSYGANFDKMFRGAASYVDRIFKGAAPADLPIEQPTTLELVVNRKTAKALGLSIPQSVLLRADRVIE